MAILASARPERVFEPSGNETAVAVKAGQVLVTRALGLFRGGLLVQADEPEADDEFAGVILEEFDLSYDGAVDGGRDTDDIGKRACRINRGGGLIRLKLVGSLAEFPEGKTAYVVDAETVRYIAPEDVGDEIRCGVFEEKLSDYEVAVRLDSGR